MHLLFILARLLIVISGRLSLLGRLLLLLLVLAFAASRPGQRLLKNLQDLLVGDLLARLELG
jgi:hypothetical protein